MDVTSRQFEWPKYALAALAIHAAVLAVPVTQKASHVVKQRLIDVIVMREEREPIPPEKVEKRAEVPKPKPMVPKVKEQIRVQAPPKPTPVLEKKESPPPGGGAGNVLDEQIVTQVMPGPATGGDEGVGVAGVNVGGGKVGLGGGGTGIGTGQGSGTGSGTSQAAPAPQAPPADTGPVEARFGEKDGPQIVRADKPEYPFEARRLRKEGRVILEIFLDVDGKLMKVDVKEATDQIFVQSAIDAVKKWKFLPAKRKGLAVASRSTLPIRFALER